MLSETGIAGLIICRTFRKIRRNEEEPFRIHVDRIFSFVNTKVGIEPYGILMVLRWCIFQNTFSPLATISFTILLSTC